MSLVCQHTLVSMSCPNRLSKPSSLANFQAMSSNQCLELLVCSYYKKKKILWSHWSQPVFSIYTTIYRGEKAVFKVLNNKKWDYRVAKWQSEQGKLEDWTKRNWKLNKTREFFPRNSVWVAAEEGIRKNWFTRGCCSTRAVYSEVVSSCSF